MEELKHSGLDLVDEQCPHPEVNFGEQWRALGEAMANTNGVGGLLEPCEHHWLVEV